MALKKNEAPISSNTGNRKVYFNDISETYKNPRIAGGKPKNGQRFVAVPFNRIQAGGNLYPSGNLPSSIENFNYITIMPQGSYKAKVNANRVEDEQIRARQYIFPQLEEYSVYDVLYELGEEYQQDSTPEDRKNEIRGMLQGVQSYPNYLTTPSSPLLFCFGIPLYDGADDNSPEFREERKRIASDQMFPEEIVPYYFELKKATIKNMETAINNWMWAQAENGGVEYTNMEEIQWYNKAEPEKSLGLMFQRTWDGSKLTKNVFSVSVVRVNATQLADIANDYVEQAVDENPNVLRQLPHFYNITLDAQLKTVKLLDIGEILEGTKLEQKYQTYLQNTGASTTADNNEEDIDDMEDELAAYEIIDEEDDDEFE